MQLSYEIQSLNNKINSFFEINKIENKKEYNFINNDYMIIYLNNSMILKIYKYININNKNEINLEEKHLIDKPYFYPKQVIHMTSDAREIPILKPIIPINSITMIVFK